MLTPDVWWLSLDSMFPQISNTVHSIVADYWWSAVSLWIAAKQFFSQMKRRGNRNLVQLMEVESTMDRAGEQWESVKVSGTEKGHLYLEGEKSWNF